MIDTAQGELRERLIALRANLIEALAVSDRLEANWLLQLAGIAAALAALDETTASSTSKASMAAA